MSSVAALGRACHPEPTAAVTAVTTAFAVSAGRGFGSVWVAAATLAGQLSVGWSNDYLDRERDRASRRPDKPVAHGRVPAPRVGVAAVLALLAAVPLSLLSGPAAAIAHLVAIGSGWSYNLGLKATRWSIAPYVLSFSLLPAFVTLGLPGQPAPPWWAVSAGGLLGAGAHLANVLPDIDDDLRTGVQGLPHRLGRRVSGLAAALLLLAATVVLALAPPAGAGPLEWLAVAAAGVVVAAGLLLARRPPSRAAFRAALVVAAIDVVLLLAGGRAVA